MSNGPRPRRTPFQPAPLRDTGIDDLLAHMVGQRIDGGCETCDAYQTVDEVIRNVYSMTVHHDDWCPFYRARVGESGAN